MPHWRILYYLLQFYLFAASGALGYLCLRAWFDPTLYRRKGDDPYRVPRWTHLLRGIGLLAVATAAMVGALREGATGISWSIVALLRLAGYALFLSSLSKVLRREKIAWLGTALIILSEILLIGRSVSTEAAATDLTFYHDIPYLALLLSDIGIGMIGVRMAHTILRIRLVDRVLISFAVFGLLLAQMVAVIEFGVLSSFDISVTEVMTAAEKPLIMTLTAVLVTSTVIGFFLARDLSEPVTKLGVALRAIGEGNLNQRVDLGNAALDDEMSDLAREVNRMTGKLRAAEEMRSDFFSFVSHELKSPLTAIKGFISTLAASEEFSPEEREEMYGIIQDETERLLRMINELLDLSRIQSGTPLSLNCEWFDLGRQLKKVTGAIGADSVRHPVEVLLPDEPVSIYADRDKIIQIVINLMSNAIKYSPSGGRVTVKLISSDSHVMLSVADQGVGMTGEQCAHIFDKFYRVAEQEGGDAAKRLRRVDGAGIGLYLTRELVQAHHGDISVVSEPGKGSVFTVSLPKRAESLETLPPDSAGSGLGRTRPSISLLSDTERASVPHLPSDPQENGQQAAQELTALSETLPI